MSDGDASNMMLIMEVTDWVNGICRLDNNEYLLETLKI